MLTALIELHGLVFGRLLVVSQAPSTRHGARWSCRCECGNTVVVYGWALRSKRTRSCGCLKREIVAALGRRQHSRRKRARGVTES
jgi:hypothetical protein